MTFRIVDPCSGCGHCILVCEPGAISGTRGERHDVDPTKCVDCGACAVVCGEGSFRDEHGERFALEGLCSSAAMRAIVRLERCTGCGDCVTSCLFKAVVRVFGGDSEPHARVIDSRCTGCGVCQLECDKDAIDLVGLPVDDT